MGRPHSMKQNPKVPSPTPSTPAHGAGDPSLGPPHPHSQAPPAFSWLRTIFSLRLGVSRRRLLALPRPSQTQTVSHTRPMRDVPVPESTAAVHPYPHPHPAIDLRLPPTMDLGYESVALPCQESEVRVPEIIVTDYDCDVAGAADGCERSEGAQRNDLSERVAVGLAVVGAGDKAHVQGLKGREYMESYPLYGESTVELSLIGLKSPPTRQMEPETLKAVRGPRTLSEEILSSESEPQGGLRPIAGRGTRPHSQARKSGAVCSCQARDLRLQEPIDEEAETSDEEVADGIWLRRRPKADGDMKRTSELTRVPRVGEASEKRRVVMHKSLAEERRTKGYEAKARYHSRQVKKAKDEIAEVQAAIRAQERILMQARAESKKQTRSDTMATIDIPADCILSTNRPRGHTELSERLDEQLGQQKVTIEYGGAHRTNSMTWSGDWLYVPKRPARLPQEAAFEVQKCCVNRGQGVVKSNSRSAKSQTGVIVWQEKIGRVPIWRSWLGWMWFIGRIGASKVNKLDKQRTQN